MKPGSSLLDPRGDERFLRALMAIEREPLRAMTRVASTVMASDAAVVLRGTCGGAHYQCVPTPLPACQSCVGSCDQPCHAMRTPRSRKAALAALAALRELLAKKPELKQPANDALLTQHVAPLEQRAEKRLAEAEKAEPKQAPSPWTSAAAETAGGSSHRRARNSRTTPPCPGRLRRDRSRRWCGTRRRAVARRRHSVARAR